MGSMTFTVVGDASVGTRTKTFSIPDADVNRFIAMCQEWYGQPAVAQAMLAWANDVMGVTKERVIRSEKEAAARAAGPPFTAT